MEMACGFYSTYLAIFPLSGGILSSVAPREVRPVPGPWPRPLSPLHALISQGFSSVND